MVSKTMEGYAALELRHVELGDARLNRRLVHTVGALSARPNGSISEVFDGNWADIKGIYRFWDSDRVSPDAIGDAHTQSTLERLEGHKVVLAIQDTTSFDFTHHPATKGLGPLEHPFLRGLSMHSVLLATPQRVPLGIIHREVWARDPKTVGKRHRRRQLETKDKESQRWLTALKVTQELVPEDATVITIADREADIYDLLALPRRARHELLIRATHDRRVNHQAGKLWKAIEQSPVRGEVTIRLKRKDNKPARKATLTIRYETLEVRPPAYREKREALKPISIQVVLAQEEDPPQNVAPVKWLLYTTLPVNTFQDAVQCVELYSCRWLIERFHFVLKSGCNLEKLQLQEAQRIEKALATYCIVAWQLLWLTYEARQNPDISCDGVLASHEWQSLYCTVHKTSMPPDKPPTLREAVRWIAKLGGFIGRRRDGEPGVKTIWRGLRRLHDISETWKLSRPEPSVTSTPNLWVKHSPKGGEDKTPRRVGVGMGGNRCVKTTWTGY